MKKAINGGYSDIVEGLAKLRGVTPNRDFRSYIKNDLALYLKPHFSYYSLFALGLKSFAAVFALVLFGGSTIVLAAEGSKPGDLLFGVKEAVKDVRIELTFHPEVIVDSSDQIQAIASVQTPGNPPATSQPGGEQNTNITTNETTKTETPTDESPSNESTPKSEEPILPVPQIQTNVRIEDGAEPSPQPSSEPIPSGQQQTTQETKTLELNVSVKGQEVVKFGL